MKYSRGLEGVIADQTAISDVEGDIGRLSYRGYAIEELVALDYEAVMWLVLFGELPSAGEQARLTDWLAVNGVLAPTDIDLLGQLPAGLHPMRMLQGLIPLLGDNNCPEFPGLSAEGAAGLSIVARLPALIAGFRGLSTRSVMPAYDQEVGYLQNFLTMFTGATPSAEHLDVFRTVQILQMEHSFNAGTFTGRVVASTLAPVAAVLSAAVGALAGPLHGGADEAALNDAKRVGSPGAAADFVDQLLADKGKLMGMGHREYRRVDPRAVILKPLAEHLCMGRPQQQVFETLVALETAFNAAMAKKGKEVWANLEFYKGPVYEALGIPSDYFTATFAMSRAVGWLAHFVESRADNRIIRPKADYVGAPHRRVALS